MFTPFSFEERAVQDPSEVEQGHFALSLDNIFWGLGVLFCLFFF